jgi:hypothetical protein
MASAIEYIVVALVLFNEMKKMPFKIFSIFGTRINGRTGVNKGRKQNTFEE